MAAFANVGCQTTAINLDASDPDFAASLRSLGAVQPSPTFSNSSTFNQAAPSPSSPNGTTPTPGTNQQVFPSPSQNPALRTVEARDRLAQDYEREVVDAGKRGHEGREFLDVVTIRQVLAFRDGKGMEAGEIERRMGLKAGVVGRLGGQCFGAVGGD